MIDGGSEIPTAIESNGTIPMPLQSVKSKAALLNILLLIIVLAVIPLTVIVLAQRTRTELKAASECKQPAIPDPSDCVGGEWKVAKTDGGCIRFRCEL